jgi:very-short-patch-repair endonuclease
MLVRSPKQTHQRAKALRKEMSPPEVMLWSRLRQLRGEGPTFRRQHAIGPFIADFCCCKAMLVIEVDGAHHTEDDQIARDEARSAYLRQRGYRMLRIRRARSCGTWTKSRRASCKRLSRPLHHRADARRSPSPASRGRKSYSAAAISTPTASA